MMLDGNEQDCLILLVCVQRPSAFKSVHSLLLSFSCLPAAAMIQDLQRKFTRQFPNAGSSRLANSRRRKSDISTLVTYKWACAAANIPCSSKPYQAFLACAKGCLTAAHNPGYLTILGRRLSTSKRTEQHKDKASCNHSEQQVGQTISFISCLFVSACFKNQQLSQTCAPLLDHRHHDD